MKMDENTEYNFKISLTTAPQITFHYSEGMSMIDI